MSLSEQTITEPHTPRGVRAVPREGGVNLPQQCGKAALPYSTISASTPFFIWMGANIITQNPNRNG